MIKDLATLLPDEVMDKRKTIRLGGTTLELSFHGLNHSDSTIVMRLPKYENWPGYKANLQFVLRRYCGLWGRGT